MFPLAKAVREGVKTWLPSRKRLNEGVGYDDESDAVIGELRDDKKRLKKQVDQMELRIKELKRSLEEARGRAELQEKDAVMEKQVCLAGSIFYSSFLMLACR